MNDNYVYLIGSLFLFLIWLFIYFIFKSEEGRKEMLKVSFATSLLGLTEAIFVPEYWNPPTIFNLAERTGFDLESILFSFAVGGVAAVLYEVLLQTKREKISSHEQHQKRHRFHRLALSSPFISFALLYLLTPLNPIYSAIIAMFIGAVASWYCRPDLLKPMIVGSLSFLTIYFVVFLVGFVLLFPGYVEAVWNLSAISGILIFGVPIEEMFFASTLGAMWSSIYEHFYWYKFKV